MIENSLKDLLTLTLKHITSYSQPNVEKFCDMWGKKRQKCSKLPDY